MTAQSIVIIVLNVGTILIGIERGAWVVVGLASVSLLAWTAIAVESWRRRTR